jgi:hypothetical protein
MNKRTTTKTTKDPINVTPSLMGSYSGSNEDFGSVGLGGGNSMFNVNASKAFYRGGMGSHYDASINIPIKKSTLTIGGNIDTDNTGSFNYGANVGLTIPIASKTKKKKKL